MKVAYLVLCHKNSNILKETVTILKDSDIYIHVDKKSDITKFSNLMKISPNVKFVSNRIDVAWGAFSQVQAMLSLFTEANNGSYDYIFLISGDDMPLMSEIKIKEFLNKNLGKQFMAVEKHFPQADLDKRIKYNYNKLYFKKSKTGLQAFTVNVQHKFNLFPRNKYYETLPKIYKGSQWFGLSRDALKYVFDYLDQHKEYIKAFEHSFCSDEMFFQTIIFNSPYAKDIYNNEKPDEMAMNLRYIDWKTGPEFPKMLDEGDFDKIAASNCLFARKFSDKVDMEKYRERFLK